MCSMREEELFESTQPQEDDGERDDVYLELAKAITERKCRIEQKKEKLKLIINEMIKQDEQLKSAIDEKEHLEKEVEEVSIQKNLRLQNIKNVQETRATLETTLCDLNNKVSLEREETKRKKDEFDGAIKGAWETWESYKEKYENFPLARKLQKVAVEVKKVEIASKQAEMDIIDFNMKKRLKYNIAEKRFHQSVVKMAENYKTYQMKIKENRELQEKIMQMKKLAADIKSGKGANHQLESSQVAARNVSRTGNPEPQSPPNVMELFTVPGIQVTSPPPPPVSEGESSGGGRLFSWGNLLGSTGLFESYRKPVDKTKKLMPNMSHEQTPSSSVTNLRPESQKDKTPYNVKNIGSSLKLTNLLRSVSFSQKKPEVNVGSKRSQQNESKGEANKEQRSPPKRVCNATHQSTKFPDTVSNKSNNTVVKEKAPQGTIKKDLANENLFYKENKENTNPRISYSSSDVKSCTPSIIGNNRDKLTMAPMKSVSINTNLMNILSLQSTGNQTKASVTLKKNVHEQTKTAQVASGYNQRITQHDQQKRCSEELLQIANNKNRQNQQLEVNPILFEPGSPAPDLIPVEANTESSSQGNAMQTCSPINYNLSGDSDFISPGDCDEATKAAYERMQSQEHYMLGEYSRSTMNIQKHPSEETAVRSQYFADSNTLNTPSDGAVGDQTPIGQNQSPIVQQFSPPYAGYTNSPLMDINTSPPPANIGGFDESASVSNTNFNFMMGGAAKSKSSTSFLDIF